jgi:hypothetical protein
MTVQEMLARMSSEELSMWMAYEVLEPFGQVRADMRSAQICSTLANINRSKETKPFSVSDFMFRFDQAYLTSAGSDEMAGKAKIQSVMGMSGKKGAVRLYEGEAPAIRKIGKRGKTAKSGKRKF